MSAITTLAFIPVERLPALNATLNATAGILLVVGYMAIRQRRERLHKRIMLTAFCVSTAFLASYLIYHALAGSRRFEGPQTVRIAYLVILVSHVVLAATVPVLALVTIFFGLRDRRAAHRRVARWTLPIWLYVSITGVVIYWMLYHAYPASAAGDILPGKAGVASSATLDRFAATRQVRSSSARRAGVPGPWAPLSS